MGTFIAAFFGGMLSFLSPCVLPLVPGYLSMMSGVGVTQLATARGADIRRLLTSTLLFCAGFTIVFTALGATATVLGQTLLRNTPLLRRVSGLIIIAMGLLLAGVIAPRLLQRERRLQVLPERFGVFAPPVMGMAFAFGWTPCIGPILTVVLTAAGRQDDVGRGIALLLTYSAGLAVPFVAAGVGLARLAGVLNWFKVHARVVDGVAGALLVVFGVLLFTNRLGWMSGRLVDALDAIGLDRLANV